MNATPEQKIRSYRLSFIINTAIGGLLLLLAVIGYLIELSFPAMRHSGLVWGFIPGALICFSIALAHRKKHLSLTR